jgi:hypothetical protein
MLNLIAVHYRLWIYKRAVERAREVAEAYLQITDALVWLEPNEENLRKQSEARRKLGRLRTQYARLSIKQDALRDNWRQFFGFNF